MANLPPRPESPPRMRDDRRHSPVDRDRDRLRSAQPMALRFRGDRPPERERTYVPRPRPDTYIAPGYDARRDTDGRRDYDDRDRERDRHRDFDRDKRNWGRPRDWSRDRSPRRRGSPDRDRRPYDRDRGPPRRPPSPLRRSGPPYRRDSRSPRRRPFSPSPPHRSRYRSRTRSPRPSSPKRVRLGNHSIATSPRSRSPYKRCRSRDRSPSPRNRPLASTSTPVPSNELKISSPARSLKRVEVEDIQPHPVETIPAELKEKPPVALADQPKTPNEPSAIPIGRKSESPKPASPMIEQRSEPEITKAEPSEPAFRPPVEQKKMEDVIHRKVDIADSPKPPTTASSRTPRSPSPPRQTRPSSINDSARTIPSGPQRGWAPRSPPRGPRNHPRQMTASHGAPSYPTGPRGPRRGFQPSGPGSVSYSNSPHTKQGGDPDVKPLSIPKYNQPKVLSDMDKELARLQTHRANLAMEHVHQVKGLRRALHELDMTSIDLHAAESRRRIAEIQLEKAKTGSLGMDATELVEL